MSDQFLRQGEFSRWITPPNFELFSKLFITFFNSSKENLASMVLEYHKSRVSLAVLNMAKDNDSVCSLYFTSPYQPQISTPSANCKGTINPGVVACWSFLPPKLIIF